MEIYFIYAEFRDLEFPSKVGAWEWSAFQSEPRLKMEKGVFDKKEAVVGAIGRRSPKLPQIDEHLTIYASGVSIRLIVL